MHVPDGLIGVHPAMHGTVVDEQYQNLRQTNAIR